MRTVSRFILFLALSQPAFSEEKLSKLHGSWHSDGEATNKFLSKHTRLSAHQKKLFPLLFGNAVIVYNPDGTGSITMQPAVLPRKEGGQVETPLKVTNFTYKILDESESQVVIKAEWQDPVYRKYPFGLITFHDSGSYSVSLSDGPMEVSGREFFTRVTDTRGLSPFSCGPCPEVGRGLSSLR